jgi:hypothetical protein
VIGKNTLRFCPQNLLNNYYMEEFLYILMLSPLYYILKYINYIQILYDNKVYNNFITNHYITNYHINRLSFEIKQYIYDQLFVLTYYDKYYILNYIIFKNKIHILPYDEQLKSIKSYKKYPLLYNNILINIEIDNCDVNDKQKKINELFEKKIITKEKKNKLLFDNCNIISSDTLGYIVNEILHNKNNDDYVYNHIKYRFIKESNLSNICNLLNIPKDDIKILIEYNYLKFLNNLSQKFDYRHCNKYMHEIEILIDKTYNNSLFKNLHDSLLLKYYTYKYNILNQTEYKHNIFDMQLYNFNNIQSYYSLFDILACLYNNQDYDKLSIFIKNNLNYIKLFKNDNVLKNIIPILLNVINYNYNNDLTEILKELYYNEFQIYIAKLHNKILVCQNPVSITRTIYDNLNKSVCLICLDEYNNNKVVLCLNCNKYIGHFECINEIKNPKCLYCNKN